MAVITANGTPTGGRSEPVKPVAPDTFLQACGAAGPLSALVIGPGENDRRRVMIDRGFVLVGRHPRACISLADKRVGLRHLYLQVLDGQVYGIDLGSRAGVFRGLVRFSTGWAAPGSFFRLDPYHVSIDFRRGPNAGSFSSDDPVSHRSDPSAFPALSADVLVGNVRQTRWKMTRRLVLVGRDPSARLRLRDESISRFHAALVGTPHGVWVVDLLSREGTWVNGTKVPYARLVSGDRMRVGCYDLYVQTEKPPPPALPAPAADPGRALILPTAADLPGAVVPAPSPDAGALLPVLQQFGLFQQQMLDQFQQSLLLMLQTFAKMNSDQMELIREELAELRRLTQELHDARQQLDATPKGSAPAATPATTAAPGPSRPPTKPIPNTPSSPAHPSQPSPQDVDVHAWLSGRIATLENQREGVLKRVIRKITGG
jgi:pSer/pThr/pTyr-binding forkhead associated (FHA) protein